MTISWDMNGFSSLIISHSQLGAMAHFVNLPIEMVMFHSYLQDEGNDHQFGCLIGFWAIIEETNHNVGIVSATYSDI